MIKTHLNKTQISELIKDKIVKVRENETIEFYDESIIYNNCGKISYIESLSLNFGSTESHNEFIQHLICEHFNVQQNKVITISSNLEDSEFLIRFTPENEINIIVYPITTIIKIEKLTKKSKINEKTTQIGIYKRLCNSSYFFRINFH